MKTIKKKVKDLNLFQMYEKNAYKYGFWFDSWKWANTCARLLYFEYKGKHLKEHCPIIVNDLKKVNAICEFWNIKQRKCISVRKLSVPWNTENYIYWDI